MADKIMMLEANGLKIKFKNTRADRGVLKDLLFNDKAYFGNFRNFFGNKVNFSGIMLDIGANIGAVSVWAAKIEGMKVIAYEPVPETFELLRENVKLNNAENLVEVHNQAVSNYNGKAVIHYSRSQTTAASIYNLEKGNPNKVEVDAVDIRDIIKKYQEINFLKLDCEGSEYDILNSIEDFSKIKNMFVEFHIKKDTPRTYKVKNLNHTKEEADQIIRILSKDFELKIIQKSCNAEDLINVYAVRV